MDNNMLSYILDAVEGKPANVYGRGAFSSAMANYARVLSELERPFIDRRDKRGKRFLTLLREDGGTIGDIEPSRLPTCERRTKAICNSKIKSASIWEDLKIPTPHTRVYREDEKGLAYAQAFKGRHEVVVKAHSLTLGAGVFLNVREGDFDESFDECVQMQRDAGRVPLVLVQEMVKGFEMRATVVEGVVDNFLLKIPAYVTGDGISTVDQLIDKKNEYRSANTFFRNKPIRRDHHMDAHFKFYDKSLSAIPADGENVTLSSISAIAYGGESAIVNDMVKPSVFEHTLNSVAAIPGASTAGVDLMLESFDSETPKIIEINSFPHMNCMHPYYGDGSDTARRYVKSVYAQDSFRRGGMAEVDEEDAGLLRDYWAFLEMKDRFSLERFK